LLKKGAEKVKKNKENKAEEKNKKKEKNDDKTIEVTVFWVVTPSSDEVGQQRQREPYCHHLRFTLKMEAARPSETLVSYHITASCHSPEDRTT
jgi:hypothetical protein